MFTLRGKVIVINDEQVISDKFKKRDLVIETEGERFTQKVSFQLTQDKCELLDKFSNGDEVDVYFNVKGRDWTSPQGEVKYFNTLEAWRIQLVSGGTVEVQIPDATKSGNESDLPF